MEVCKSLIPQTHDINKLINDDANYTNCSKEIIEMKEMITTLAMEKLQLEEQLKKVKKELDEMEKENDEHSQKLCDVSMAIATVISPTLRWKVADYCNSHIRRHKEYNEEDDEQDEDYDFSHDILLTDSRYDYKHEKYMKQSD